MHIALQHTSPYMLKIMNRRNKLNSDLELFEHIASKGYALGTDFIVGHPGETQEVWNEAMTNIHKFPVTHLHAFTYSKRDGTPSATMGGQINGNIAKLRLKELTAIIDKKNFEFRNNNHNLDILIEQYKNDVYVGYDQYFNQIEVSSKEDLIGNWINIDNYDVKDKINIATF
jgi:tRNA A37 methylthiotransferase MiaB